MAGYLSKFSTCLALLLVCSIATLAQGTTSRITGVISDSAGAAVSGASVTIKSASGVELTTQTNEDGEYTFDLIQPGTYEVTVEKAGFKRVVSPGNAALVNQPTTVNIALEVGDVAATVTIEGAAEAVQTSTSGNLGTTIEQKTLESLPIVGVRGRNPLDLLNFQPGVVFGGNTGGGVHVNGSRDRSFNFTLDGIDINESTAGGSNFTPLRPNPDSIQEFQIVTSNFTAELGRSSGAQVTFVTRSGTNQFRGNLFEYYQTPRFNAKSYGETLLKAPKGQFVQHIFGGSFGGPLSNFGLGEGEPFKLLRDKAFFFVNLQFLRAYDTALVTRTVYTAAARAGTFRYRVSTPSTANAPAGTTNAVVDANGNPLLPACTGTPPTNQPCIATYNIATQAPITRDPTLMGFINAMPLPNNFAAGDGLNTAGFSFAAPQNEKQYDLATKFDFKFNDEHSAFVRYARGDQNTYGDSVNGGRRVFPDAPNFVDTIRTPRNLATQWRWSPRSNITNEFVYGLSKFFFSFDTPEPDPRIPFTFLNISTPNTNFTYNARGVRTNQFIDNLTWVKGSHTFRGGINFRLNVHKDDRSGVAGTAVEPIVAFSTVSGFTGYGLPTAGAGSINATDLTLLQNTIVNQIGKLGNISQGFVVDPNNPNAFAPAGTRWLNEAKYNEFDFYFQDNWKFRQNLVFDLGLRWEIKAQPKLENRPILVPDQPVKLGAPPSNTIKFVEGELFKTDFTKILPSVGFAWDPFSSGKTSVRANYRMASDRIATFLFGSFIFQNTLGNTIGATNGTFGPSGGLYRDAGPVIAALAPTQTPLQVRQPPAFGALSTNVIDPDLQFPQIHEWSLSFQRELWKNNVLEVNYIGKKGVHLLGGYNINQVDIFASDPRCGSQTFVQAFIQAQDAAQAANPNCLASLLTGGGTGGNSAAFRTQFAADIANGNVATAAQTLARQSGATSLTARGFSPFFFQRYPQFNAGLNVFDSNDYSNYHGMQLIFKRRLTDGLGFQVSYTLSKSKDNRSWDPSLSGINTGNSQAGSSTPFDLRDRSLNYAYSDFDRRHVVQGTYVYELPFGKGKWLNPDNSVLSYIVDGWQLSGTAVYMTGRPFTVYSGRLTLGNIIQTPANCTGCTPNMGRVFLENGTNTYFSAEQRAMFSVPTPGTIGNTGRNFFRNAPYFQTDISLNRKFRFSERYSFDLRVDARNLTNTVNFDISANNNNMTLGATQFGKLFDGAGNPGAGIANASRRIQLSGKLNF
jgi:hypothetical protein